LQAVSEGLRYTSRVFGSARIRSFDTRQRLGAESCLLVLSRFCLQRDQRRCSGTLPFGILFFFMTSHAGNPSPVSLE
jgi:hypothetical protein